jgi:hypothetical protein
MNTSYNECNGKKVWIGIYNKEKDTYTVVPHAFILGKTESGNHYGQFISTMWYSERRNVRDELRYSVIVSPRSVCFGSIENHLNKICKLHDNQYKRFDYMFDCMTQYNTQKGDTIRCECYPIQGKKDESPYLSIHLRRIEEDEFYVSLPYVEFNGRDSL